VDFLAPISAGSGHRETPGRPFSTRLHLVRPGPVAVGSYLHQEPAAKVVIAFLVLAGLLCLFDQMRWQPWFYQYFFMFVALAGYAWRGPLAKSNRAALNCCALIIVSTYFWSGIQKRNASFINEVWPGMSEPLLRTLPGVQSLPRFTALIIPLLEICIAIGLLTHRFRNASVILAIASDAAILALLLTRQICTYAERPSDVQLALREKPNLFTGVRKTSHYVCDHLR
jgi:hypothetical protein